MNSLGLGRPVNSFGLGVPYGTLIVPGTGKSKAGKDYLYEETLIRIREEDEEIALFLKTILTKGLI